MSEKTGYAASFTVSGDSFALLVDVTRCSGCERCVDACVAEHGLDPVQAAADRAACPDGLSADRLCTVVSLGAGRYARRACMHCDEPSCVSACIVGGLSKTASGPVVYDADKCIGCRYCMLACPFHIPRYEWRSSFPFVKKCDLCWPRLAAGDRPACVEACPQDALGFGLRSQVLAEIDRRMHDEPGRYLNTVWGSSDFGGGSVLYISDVELDALGFGQAESEGSIPARTEPLIHKTPHIALSVATGLTALSWVIGRRDHLASHPESAAGQPKEDRDA